MKKNILNPTQFSIYILLLAVLVACTKENTPKSDGPNVTNEPGTVTAEIDGESFKNSGFLSVESELHIDEDFNQFDLQIDAETEIDGIEDRITVSIFGTDFASIKAGDIFVGGDVANGGNHFDGDFYRNSRNPGDETDIICDSEQTPASTCTITEIDHEKQLISGTFQFKAISIFDETVTFSITKGVFTEIGF